MILQVHDHDKNILLFKINILYAYHKYILPIKSHQHLWDKVLRNKDCA